MALNSIAQALLKENLARSMFHSRVSPSRASSEWWPFPASMRTCCLHIHDFLTFLQMAAQSLQYHHSILKPYPNYVAPFPYLQPRFEPRAVLFPSFLHFHFPQNTISSSPQHPPFHKVRPHLSRHPTQICTYR